MVPGRRVRERDFSRGGMAETRGVTVAVEEVPLLWGRMGGESSVEFTVQELFRPGETMDKDQFVGKASKISL